MPKNAKKGTYAATFKRKGASEMLGNFGKISMKITSGLPRLTS